MTQSLGAPWRKFMRNLNRKLDQDRKVLTAEEARTIEGASELPNDNRANEDLYFILVEKTEGDAALRESLMRAEHVAHAAATALPAAARRSERRGEKSATS